ncbi:hypothetical protein J3F83DRAFT_745528 [Trichoderma novae-zelandiae]
MLWLCWVRAFNVVFVEMLGGLDVIGGGCLRSCGTARSFLGGGDSLMEFYLGGFVVVVLNGWVGEKMRLWC